MGWGLVVVVVVGRGGGKLKVMRVQKPEGWMYQLYEKNRSRRTCYSSLLNPKEKVLLFPVMSCIERERQSDRLTNSQTDKQTDTQSDRQILKQTAREGRRQGEIKCNPFLWWWWLDSWRDVNERDGQVVMLSVHCARVLSPKYLQKVLISWTFKHFPDGPIRTTASNY